MKNIEAIVLAGGKGVRMGDITRDRQKCLLPIDGEPALGHIINNLISAFGSMDLTVCVDFKKEQVIEFINKKKSNNLSVNYVPHSGNVEGWDIYRGLRNHIKRRFVAAPGDVIALPEAYEQVVSTFDEHDAEATMTLSPDLEVIDTHGVGRIKKGKVVDLQWPPPQQIGPDYSRDMTIWSSDKNFFNLIERYPSPKKSIGVVFMKAIHDKREIAGNLYEKKWIHLGYPQDLRKSMET